MRTSEVTNALIGKRVKGVHGARPVTGTIIGIVEDKYSKGVRIKLDSPVFFASGYGVQHTEWEETEYESTARKFDDWGNLQHTELID